MIRTLLLFLWALVWWHRYEGMPFVVECDCGLEDADVLAVGTDGETMWTEYRCQKCGEKVLRLETPKGLNLDN